jgi:hypothetical protein
MEHSAGVPGQAEQPARHGGFTGREGGTAAAGSTISGCRGVYSSVDCRPIRRYNPLRQDQPTDPLLAFCLPPSYTHRPCSELARAPGGSRAHGRFPPRTLVWEIIKIDSEHRNQPNGVHADMGDGRRQYIACSKRLGVSGSSWDALGALQRAPKSEHLPYT